MKFLIVSISQMKKVEIFQRNLRFRVSTKEFAKLVNFSSLSSASDKQSKSLFLEKYSESFMSDILGSH